MAIEWLRRNDPQFDHELRTYLFTDAPVTDVEDQAMGGNGSSQGTTSAGPGGSRETGSSLGIGSLRTTDEETQP